MTAARALVCLLAYAAGHLLGELHAALRDDATDVDLGPEDALPSWLVSRQETL